MHLLFLYPRKHSPVLQRDMCSGIYYNRFCNSRRFRNKCPSLRKVLKKAMQELDKIKKSQIYIGTGSNHQDALLWETGEQQYSARSAIHLTCFKFYRYKPKYGKHLDTNKLTVVNFWRRTGIGSGCQGRFCFLWKVCIVFFSNRECIHVLLL